MEKRSKKRYNISDSQPAIGSDEILLQGGFNDELLYNTYLGMGIEGLEQLVRIKSEKGEPISPLIIKALDNLKSSK